ncbi:MAG TPA: hypothetical protein ENH29_10635 [Bacteroidetes bacterium]|nr:hypothetical protein [Bacteroidota bacterium]
MNTETKKIVFLIAIILVSGLLFARQAAAQNFQGGLNLMLGVPQGEFSDNVDNPGFGIGGMFGVSIPHSPLMVGGDLGFLIYGSETRKEPFSTTIPDVTVNVETSNNIAMGHLLLRLQAPVGAIRPYMDGLIGFNYLFTETKIKDEDYNDDEIASSTNFDDAAFSYGAGGGLQIRVYNGRYKKPKEGEKNLTGVFIDFRVRYLVGGKAEYLKEGSIARENGRVTHDVTQSKTDLLTYQLGVVFTF